VYAHLASGKPLVATRIPAHTQILDDRICFLAEPKPAAFADAILMALTSEERRCQVVEAARSFYVGRYSRTAYQRKLQALLEVLV
jgi:glycosyltransferase involved in cell wall biosynthesis